jgi:hypothetical protein
VTGVRWTRAEAEQAAADALRRSNAPIATNALTDARAVLDALGIIDTVTITAASTDCGAEHPTLRQPSTVAPYCVLDGGHDGPHEATHVNHVNRGGHQNKVTW